MQNKVPSKGGELDRLERTTSGQEFPLTKSAVLVHPPKTHACLRYRFPPIQLLPSASYFALTLLSLQYVLTTLRALPGCMQLRLAYGVCTYLSLVLSTVDMLTCEGRLA